MDEIKIEKNLSVVCHGCLSSGRTTTSLGTLSDVFYNLVSTQKQTAVYAAEDIKFCWECQAVLKKVHSFQNQLMKAANVLMQMFYDLNFSPSSLSNLSISTKNHIDYKYQQTENKKKKSKPANSDQFIDIDVKIKESNEELDIEGNDLDGIKEESLQDYDSLVDDISDPNNELTNHKTEINDNQYGDLENYEEITNLINNYSNNVTETPQADIHIHETNKKVRAKRRKCIQSRLNSVSYYKQFTTIIKREKLDWGNVESYFTMTSFGESEIEEHFLSKERKYNEYTRFKHKCVPCERGYMKRIDLQRHNDLNHKSTIFKCSRCGGAQGSLEALEKHWRTHTPVARCELCSEVCRPRGMKNHLNFAHTDKYACTFCNMKFGKILHFMSHYKSEHQQYICDYCNTACKSKILVQKHIRTYHTSFECKECARQFANYRRYKRHLDTVHPKIMEDRPELAYCVECDKQFANIHKYRRHLKVSAKHIPPKRVQLPCPDCGKMFSKKNYLNNHYNLYHANKSKHYCELCDKYFANGFGLRNHKTHVHMKVSRVKDKMCDLCGRGFATNRILLNHRRTHTGERPYQCPHCSAAFTQKQAMQSHCRTQHKDIGVK